METHLSSDADPVDGQDASSTPRLSRTASAASSSSSSESSRLFASGRLGLVNSISPEQALTHLVKAMLGTGLLSLPLAFKHAGLWLGLLLLIVICVVCLHTMRMVVHASHFVCQRKGVEFVDYANIMRFCVEAGPGWIRQWGYFAKQLVNVNMFICQLGFCCVYFVFMSANLQDFFSKNTQLDVSMAVWMLILLVPMLAICSIRQLRILAPFAYLANGVYVVALLIVLIYLFTNLRPVDSVPAVGRLRDLPLFFGTVLFAFEGVAVIMPIENRMREPAFFIAWNGVLNSSCLVVLAIYGVVGFYGYLSVGDSVHDAITLDLPEGNVFYQLIKLLFVFCIMVSYPLQFYVPMERIEKWITRRINPARQTLCVYTARWLIVTATCAVAEAIPHLALFISLIGAFSSTMLALLFPPVIEMLVAYARKELTGWLWLKNFVVFGFALLGFTTGTYSALADIAATIFAPQSKQMS